MPIKKIINKPMKSLRTLKVIKAEADSAGLKVQEHNKICKRCNSIEVDLISGDPITYVCKEWEFLSDKANNILTEETETIRLLIQNIIDYPEYISHVINELKND